MANNDGFFCNGEGGRYPCEKERSCWHQAETGGKKLDQAEEEFFKAFLNSSRRSSFLGKMDEVNK